MKSAPPADTMNVYATIGPQVGEQLPHGLIGELVVRSVEARLLGRLEPPIHPCAESSGVIPAWVRARTCRSPS